MSATAAQGGSGETGIHPGIWVTDGALRALGQPVSLLSSLTLPNWILVLFNQKFFRVFHTAGLGNKGMQKNQDRLSLLQRLWVHFRGNLANKNRAIFSLQLHLDPEVC